MSSALRIGLIGCGRVTPKHVAAGSRYPQTVRYSAVCDILEDKARQRAEETGTSAIYTDAMRLIREAEIDAVDICTTHPEHAAVAIAAAEAGKHILIEKPLAVNMEQCRAIVAAAEKAGVTLMVAQNQRYKANYRAVRRIIGEGELGAMRAVRIDSQMNVRAGAPADHWVYDGARAGGGVVISLALHRIDLARFFVGNVRRILSAVCRTTHPWFKNGAEDYAAAIFEFENGAIGTLFATYAPYRAPWGESFIVYGEKGTVHAHPLHVKYNEPCLVASEKRTPPPGDWPASQVQGFAPLELDREGLPADNMFVDEVLHFAECCRTGKEPISSGRDNLNTMATVFGIYESARTGKVVEIRGEL